MKKLKCSMCNKEITRNARYDKYICRDCENEEIMKSWYIDSNLKPI